MSRGRGARGGSSGTRGPRVLGVLGVLRVLRSSGASAGKRGAGRGARGRTLLLLRGPSSVGPPRSVLLVLLSSSEARRGPALLRPGGVGGSGLGRDYWGAFDCFSRREPPRLTPPRLTPPPTPPSPPSPPTPPSPPSPRRDTSTSLAADTSATSAPLDLWPPDRLLASRPPRLRRLRRSTSTNVEFDVRRDDVRRDDDFTLGGPQPHHQPPPPPASGQPPGPAASRLIPGLIPAGRPPIPAGHPTPPASRCCSNAPMRFPTAAWPPTQLATHPTGHPTLLPSSSAALASLASSAFRALTFQKLLFEVPSYRLHITTYHMCFDFDFDFVFDWVAYNLG